MNTNQSHMLWYIFVTLVYKDWGHQPSSPVWSKSKLSTAFSLIRTIKSNISRLISLWHEFNTPCLPYMGQAGRSFTENKKQGIYAKNLHNNTGATTHWKKHLQCHISFQHSFLKTSHDKLFSTGSNEAASLHMLKVSLISFDVKSTQTSSLIYVLLHHVKRYRNLPHVLALSQADFQD